MFVAMTHFFIFLQQQISQLSIIKLPFNLNVINVKLPINEVSLDLMCSVSGTLRSKKLDGSNE